MKTKIKYLSSEDMNKSRKEIDRVYEIYREGFPFSEDDLKEALEKVIGEASECIGKSNLPPS